MNERLKSNFKYQLKQNKLGTIALIIIFVLVIASILAFLSPHDPNKIDVMNSLSFPSKDHIFGTDEMGRDYFARALYGGRVSLTVGFLSMIISTVIGTIVGTTSGYFGGRIDNLIMLSLIHI